MVTMEAASAHLHTVFVLSSSTRNLAMRFGIEQFRKVSEDFWVLALWLRATT